jgi:hypothetical protein
MLEKRLSHEEFCFAKNVACCDRNVILSSGHVTKMCTCSLSAVGFYTSAHFVLKEKLVCGKGHSVLICVVVHSVK